MATINSIAGRVGLEGLELAGPLRGRRVLLVDDDASIRLVCRANLAAAGFEVVEAQDGAGALELAMRRPPDLVLTELRMPGLDGVGLAEALRREQSTRTVPVVFLSGETGVAERLRAYALGAAGFVAKPFDPVALVALLVGVLERTALRLDA